MKVRVKVEVIGYRLALGLTLGLTLGSRWRGRRSVRLLRE